MNNRRCTKRIRIRRETRRRKTKKNMNGSQTPKE
jgi:hypothetical protein